MDFRGLRNGKNLLILLVLLTLALVTAGYFLFGKPPRVPMEKYTPATALAYIEVDSLTGVLDGLTDTRAWEEIAPVLGLSSQLSQLGSGIDLASRTGLGPDELVIAGRAQYAVAVTGVEANAEGSEEGVSLRLKPRFALLAETHSSAAKAERLVNERVSILAGRIFGNAMREESKDYQGTRLLVFRGEGEDRQLVAAASGSVVLIGNHESAVQGCLDSIASRAETLEKDATLKARRKEVGENPAMFAYVTQAGIEKFAQLAPAVFAARVTSDPERIGTIAGLFAHLSKQAAAGFFYGLEFQDDAVVEKYLTVMRSELAAGLKQAFKQTTQPGFESLKLVPADALSYTVLNVESAGAIPERTLRGVSSSLDVVASLALREFVISLREQFGLEGGDTLERAVGDDIAVVKMSEDEPTLMLVRVRDRAALAAPLTRYLTKSGAKVSTVQFEGKELSVSTNEDGRAAAFVGDYLVLGTQRQIENVINTQASGQSAFTDPKVKQVIGAGKAEVITSFEADEKKAAEMMLAVSKLTRVTDGSPELLETEAMRKALQNLPRSSSQTVFEDYGIRTTTNSAVGIFRRLAGLFE